MSVSPPSPVQPATRTAESPAPRTAVRPEDRDAWAANLINEMRRAARGQTGRSL